MGAFNWKPPRISLARDGRKFPSPYAAIVEAVAHVLKGEWTIRSETQGKATLIHIVLADRDDLHLLEKMFQLSRCDLGQSPRRVAKYTSFHTTRRITSGL